MCLNKRRDNDAGAVFLCSQLPPEKSAAPRILVAWSATSYIKNETMNIYVANFNTELTDEKLKDMFTPYGNVSSAKVMIDGFTDRSRGFGYVEMPDESEATNAISALNQKTIDGMVLTVSEAAPLEERKGSYKVGNGVNPYRFKKG